MSDCPLLSPFPTLDHLLHTWDGGEFTTILIRVLQKNRTNRTDRGIEFKELAHIIVGLVSLSFTKHGGRLENPVRADAAA